ncbi:5' nucleotidase, NT5C type [Planococcus sp. X10-3]|uniref:5' nucleotidase, NT5C type n=1 Tax=Planococcus sp. X10-3 TaxID=3061240 RepID=UPI003BB165C6
MKFGFDVDDTLINLREYAFHYYKKQLGLEVAIDVFRSLDRLEIHEAFGMTDAEGKEMWNQSLDYIYYTDCPTYPGAVDVLQRLDAEGHEIYYITARPAHHAEDTKAWLKNQGFPLRDAHFYCGMKDEKKVEIIEELELDYYFDDKPEVLETLANHGLNVFVKDQSYNRHLDMPRFKEWTELDGLIKKQ